MTDKTDMTSAPKYQRLATDVRTWLDNGMFEPGEPVPSIADLAADRGWSRQTCARALQKLEVEGRLIRLPGREYYVASPDAQANQPQ